MSLTLKEKTTAEISTPAVSKATLFIDAADEKLKKKLSSGTIVNLEGGASAVTSVFGRIGDVTSEYGDYDAMEIAFTPAGDITSSNVQLAIEELDADKLPLSHEGSGGAAHSLVSGVEAGFMSSSDKTKLDGIEAGANATILSTASPQSIGTAAAGSSSQASKSDHVHAHGNQSGGSLHAVATISVDGFLSATDKSKIDGIEAGANATVISSALPQAIGIAAPGVSSQVSKSDHVHAHGDQAGGALHALATTSISGFMSSADKVKIDSVQSNATQNQTDAYLLARANHTGTQLAATVSDFSSAADARITLQKGAANGLATLDASSLLPAAQHGSYTDPTDHAVATASDAGFMSASDKSKLDTVQANATQNQTDAYLLDRANHTGTQGASTIANLTGLSLPAFGQIQSADTLLVALAKLMSQSALVPIVMAQSMTVPTGHIYRRPQLTTLAGASTKLSLVGTARLTIRA
jgi:hypothetical protein